MEGQGSEWEWDGRNIWGLSGPRDHVGKRAQMLRRNLRGARWEGLALCEKCRWPLAGKQSLISLHIYLQNSPSIQPECADSYCVPGTSHALFCSIFYNKPVRISQADEDLEGRKVKKCIQGHKVGGRAGISSLGFLAPDHSTWQGSARCSLAFWASRGQCRERCRGICSPPPPPPPTHT